MANTSYCLSEAIKIAQEHASSGNVRPVETILEEVYRKLVKLQDETR